MTLGANRITGILVIRCKARILNTSRYAEWSLQWGPARRRSHNLPQKAILNCLGSFQTTPGNLHLLLQKQVRVPDWPPFALMEYNGLGYQVERDPGSSSLSKPIRTLAGGTKASASAAVRSSSPGPGTGSEIVLAMGTCSNTACSYSFTTLSWSDGTSSTGAGWGAGKGDAVAPRGSAPRASGILWPTSGALDSLFPLGQVEPVHESCDREALQLSAKVSQEILNALNFSWLNLIHFH